MDPANEHRREPRYPFFAAVELLEAQHDTRISARTADLSLHGCYVDTMNPFPVGSQVRVIITHAGTTFTGLGVVAHSRANVGMGISFASVETEQREVLMRWLAEVHGD